jgi:hypothetical protein
MMVWNQNDAFERIQSVQQLPVGNIDPAGGLAGENTVVLKDGYRFPYGNDGHLVLIA